MAEWLTHVLLAYALFTVLGWAVTWIDEGWVAVGMIGAIVPDLDRLGLILSGDVVAYFLGVPFGWGGLHALGGIVLLCGVGALLFDSAGRQKRGFLVLFGGALSHLLVDLPQPYADGRMITNTYLFPLRIGRPPTPGWYVSPDRWVVVVALAVAGVVFVLDRVRERRETADPAGD